MSKKYENRELSKLHYINVNPKGTFANWPSDRFSKYHTSPEDVMKIAQAWRSHECQHIALFFHGGLVGEGNGMEAGVRFYDFYNGKSGVYPIAFIWETGFLSALVAHWERKIKEADFKDLALSVVERVFKKLNIQDEIFSSEQKELMLESFRTGESEHGMEMQSSLFEEAAQSYEGYTLEELEGEMEQEEIKNSSRDVSSQKGIEQINELWGRGAISVAKIAARSIWRFAKRRHHGIATTILEEVYRALNLVGNYGTKDLAVDVWEQMKVQASLMWNSEANGDGDDQCAGRFFLEQLRLYRMEMEQKGKSVKIEAVAHSAGSIAVCELINFIHSNPSYKDLRFNNVIFLAPAVRCDVFEQSVMKYPNVYNRFRMFTMQKEYELRDRLIDYPIARYLYPSSLLYLVSGLCEDGRLFGRIDFEGDTCILGLHQHISDHRPYDRIPLLQRIHEFLNDPTAEQRLVLTPTPEGTTPGFCGQAIDHGDFDNDGDEHHQTLNRYEGSIRQSVDVMLGQ
jgi:hypothetical protein